MVSLGSYAFSGCGGPAGVTNIGSAPFYKCAALLAISVVPENPNYSSEAGVLLNKAKTLLVEYPVEEVVLTSFPRESPALGSLRSVGRPAHGCDTPGRYFGHHLVYLCQLSGA